MFLIFITVILPWHDISNTSMACYGSQSGRQSFICYMVPLHTYIYLHPLEHTSQHRLWVFSHRHGQSYKKWLQNLYFYLNKMENRYQALWPAGPLWVLLDTIKSQRQRNTGITKPSQNKKLHLGRIQCIID